MSVTTGDYIEALNTINDWLDQGYEGYSTKKMKSLVMKLVKETKDIGIQYRDGDILAVERIYTSGLRIGRYWINWAGDFRQTEFITYEQLYNDDDYKVYVWNTKLYLAVEMFDDYNRSKEPPGYFYQVED